MSDAQGRTRRWPLRIAQYSPLVGFALVSLIWFSVPLQVVPGMLNTNRARASEHRLQIAETARHAGALGMTCEENYDYHRTATNASQDWATSLGAHPTTASVLSPAIVHPSASAFSKIRQWERAHNARVWAWVAPMPVQPAVVASATGDPGGLSRVQARLRDQCGDPPSDALALLWADAPLPQGSTPSYGSGTANRLQWELSGFTLENGGRLWRALIVNTHPASDMHLRTELSAMDPQSPHFAQDVARFAQDAKVSVWVLGPLALPSAPLRVPQGMSTRDAEALGELVWPQVAIDGSSDECDLLLHPLSGEMARLAGGSRGFVSVIPRSGLQFRGTSEGGFDSLHGVAFFAAFNTPPLPWWERIQEHSQRFIASWFPYLLGGTVGFLVLTLVLSPAAFVRERRLIARERVREDMARIRRDAHDKVYNRLSALSKRVAATGDEVATSNATALSAIAEDIRTTVGELQAILGEEVRHTNRALTSVPLAEQLRSVCAAQSARLGVEVPCEADADLPQVDPRLGWDLQCIAEEAITNAVRHGCATHVRVSLTATDAELELTVADNGTGSRVLRAEDAPSDSTGLRGMRDRLDPRGGSLTLAVDAGSGGTVLRAQVQLPNDPLG